MKQVRNGTHLALLALASALLAIGVFAPSVGAILAGDVNGDCKVDIFDLAAVGLAFGSDSINSSGSWNPAADVRADGIINIFDLASVGLAYGDTESPCTVPLDFRVNADWSNLNQLALYDAVEQVGFVSRPWGFVKFEDTTPVPTGWRLWFLDNGVQPAGWTPPPQFLIGMQPIGVMDVDLDHTYVFTTSIAIRGDDDYTTNVDEGANINSPLSVIGRDLSTNKFYLGSFSGGVVYYQPSDMSRHDVIIDRNSPVP